MISRKKDVHATLAVWMENHCVPMFTSSLTDLDVDEPIVATEMITWRIMYKKVRKAVAKQSSLVGGEQEFGGTCVMLKTYARELYGARAWLNLCYGEGITLCRRLVFQACPLF